MKFSIKKSRTKTGPEFEVCCRTYAREEILKLCPENPDKSRHDWRVPRNQWSHFGFSEDMTFDEAKSRGQQINAQKKLDDEAVARSTMTKKLKAELNIKSAFLPPLMTAEFEDKLYEDSYLSEEDFLRSKKMSAWRSAKKIIKLAKVKVSDYEDRKIVFYKLFLKEKYSLSTVEKLVAMINKWGKFTGKKQKVYFEPLPMPIGADRFRIDDAYYDSGKISKESAPLYPIDLDKQEENFSKEQFRWLYISLWFGLRPIEIDSLTKDNKGKNWEIVKQGKVTVLRVYQTKLTKIEKSKRWKQIPILFDEQKVALKYIKQGELKRPLVKTVKRYLGEKYTTYAGRKGFEALLNRKNIPLEIISRYMGHMSVERTYKNYQDVSKARLPDNL
jgi:integrase